MMASRLDITQIFCDLDDFYLLISDRGELLAFKLTAGNVDDRKPLPEMTSDPASLTGAKERASVGSRHLW